MEIPATRRRPEWGAPPVNEATPRATNYGFQPRTMGPIQNLPEKASNFVDLSFY